MHTSPVKASFYFFTLLLISLLYACVDSEEIKTKHLEKARTHIAEANYDKARIELKNVLQIDPKTAEAYNLLGQVEEHRKEWRSALSNYLKATELDPNILDAQIRLAQYYLSFSNRAKSNKDHNEEKRYLDMAQQKISDILKTHPDSISAKTVHASILSQQGKIEPASRLLKDILNQEPATYSAILLLSKIYEDKKDNNNALLILNRGIKHLPDNILLKQNLATFYKRHQQLDKAIAILEKLVAENPDNFDYTISLAYYYELNKQPNKTETVLREAIKLNPLDAKRYIMLSQFLVKWNGIELAIAELASSIKEQPDLTELKVFLVSLYLKHEKTADAITLLESITSKTRLGPEYIDAQKKLAEIYLSNDEIEKAKQHNNAILKEYPNDSDALILNAKIAFKERDYKTTITDLRLVLKFRPDSIEILQLLSDAYVKEQETELAEEVLKKIAYLQPKNVTAQLDIARFNIASNKPDQALKQINLILNDFPENLHALKLKTEVLLAKGDINAAIPIIDRIKKLAAEDAEGWFRMGRIYKILKKPDLAIIEFEAALKKSPDSDSLLAELIDLEIASAKTVNARDRLQKILQQNPSHASAHKFIAMTHLAEKSPDKAKAEFEIQLNKHPEDPTSYQQLANIELSKRTPHNAINYYLKGLNVLPNNQTLSMGLASLYEQLKKYDAAIPLYKNVLSHNPDNVVATNNLAMILVNTKNDHESHALAEKLVGSFKASNQAILLDTYGWVNYHTGHYKQSITALTKAISLTPDIPVYYYHLGLVHKDTGNTKLAIVNLETALNKGSFPGMEDAKKILESIKP